MTRDDMLADLKLADEYAFLRKRAKVSKEAGEQQEIAERMAAIVSKRAALRPKRARGRPRIHAVGHRQSQAKGTPAQQARARSLRVQKAQLIAGLKVVQAAFDELAVAGGPSR